MSLVWEVYIESCASESVSDFEDVGSSFGGGGKIPTVAC